VEFYPAGAVYGFLLDRLNPTGEWKSTIVSDPTQSMRELVSIIFKQG